MAKASKISDKSVTEFKEHLLERGVSEDVATHFEKNRVSGRAFMKLKEEDLKELVPLVGDRTEVRSILRECQKVGVLIIIVILAVRIQESVNQAGVLILTGG